MPLTPKYNLWTFHPTDSEGWIYLNGEQITRRCGLEPDTWSFEIPRSEYAKLIAEFDLTWGVGGVIKLWHTNHPDSTDPPDVIIGGGGALAIVNIEPARIGREPADTEDVALSYLITIQDTRRGYVEPRGARLMQGRMNPEPLPDGETLYTNQQLIEMCIDAMGTSVTVGTSVDDVEPMRELDWSFAHAATALQSLLEHTGHIYAPLLSGQAQVMKPGTGGGIVVEPGRLEKSITHKAIDGRPAFAIFTSAPTPKIHTFDEEADEPPEWKYVIQDPEDDQWKPLADVTALTDPASTWAKQFEDLDEEIRGRIKEQLYCCIQLDPEKYPPGKVSLLPKWIDLDLLGSVPAIVGDDDLLVQDFRGTFSPINGTTPLLARQVVPEANVLIFPHPLMKQPTAVAAQSSCQLHGLHEPMPEEDLKPTFSVEAWDIDNSRREYPAYGFFDTGLAVTTMSESASIGYLTFHRELAAIFQSPDLLQVIKNPGTGETTNRDTMEARAETYAQNVFHFGTPDPQELHIQGFMAVELTGVVSEVTYLRTACRTIVTYFGHNLRSRCAGDAFDTGGGGEGITRNVNRQQSRSLRASRHRSRGRSAQLGLDGQGKLHEPTRPHVRPQSWPEMLIVNGAAAITSNAGRYTGKGFTPKPDVAATGDLAEADIGEQVDDVELWNIDEAGTGSKLLRTSDKLLAFMAPTHDTRGKPIAIAFPNQIPSATFPVKLTSTGGSGGSVSTTPSFVYTVKNLDDVEVATGVSPLAGRIKGLHTAATYGLAFIDTSVPAVKLLLAFETPDTTACEDT